MKSLDVSFDIDGTLLDNSDPYGRKLHLEMLTLLHFMAKKCKNVRVCLYSARPLEQQKELANRLGIEHLIGGYYVKGSGYTPDVHFDDQHEVALGDKNIIIRMK